MLEGRPTEDTELVERARDGDVSAYEELILRYQSIATRVAYVITRSAADAEDAAQDAFVRAYYALPRFRSGAAFRPWLIAIVANQARDKLRARGRREGLALRLAEARPSGDAAPSPEVAAFADEDHRMVVDALNRLPERDRQVLAYRYFLDLSEAEMAAAMRVARGTVKSRLARAQERLRALLPREVQDDA